MSLNISAPVSDLPEAPLDLDAYFSRIAYTGSREVSVETLHGIVERHVLTIPFENLDPLMQRPVRLDSASIQQKLIHDRRGGYCFEQNGLLLLALETLGFEVRPLSARVKIGYPREQVTPRTHLIVRIELEGMSWLADVGVGGLSPTAALRLVTDEPQPTPHETRRIVKSGSLYYHQALLQGEWQDLYEMTLEEMPLIDREVANWFTSTHPGSRFRNLLMVSRAAPDGVRLTMLNDEFSIRDANGVAKKHLIGSKQEMLDLLAEHFGVNLSPDDPIVCPAVPWLAE
ncbi:arylamine N-acetyltransferase [Bremerella cremea]|uniref:arylamine N-acetyltransferase family protein n=1 Tax=Bremerella cremea TaxID=1031537 RepID=UPI0031F0A0A2